MFGMPFRAIFRGAHDHFVGHTIFFFLVGMIVLFSERLRSRRVCSLGLIELTEVGVRQSDVVEDLRCMVEHAEGSIPGEAPLESLERPSDVATDAGDGAEILVDHGHRLGVPDGFRSAARLSVNQLGAIENPKAVDFLRAASLWAKEKKWSRAAAVLQAGLQAFPNDMTLGRSISEVTQIKNVSKYATIAKSSNSQG